MFVKDSVSNMKKMWTHLRCVVLHVELDLKLVLIVGVFDFVGIFFRTLTASPSALEAERGAEMLLLEAWQMYRVSRSALVTCSRCSVLATLLASLQRAIINIWSGSMQTV